MYQPPAPVYNWTGCYVGSTIGGTWGESNHISTGPNGSNLTTSNISIGIIPGGQGTTGDSIKIGGYLSGARMM